MLSVCVCFGWSVSGMFYTPPRAGWARPEAVVG